MGIPFSVNWMRLFQKRQKKVLIVGEENAGKTTILNEFSVGDIVARIEIVGFNIEMAEDEDFKFTVWDFGGPARSREVCRRYYENIKGIIFVVDSTDLAKMMLAKYELHYMLGEEQLSNVALLVFANKQDLPNAARPREVVERLGLKEITNRYWCVVPSIATEKHGLYVGLKWLTDVMN